MKYLALVPFVAVVVFGVLFILLVLKGKSPKLPAIGMGVSFLLVVAMGVMAFLGVGLFGGADVTLTIPADFVEDGMTQESLDAAVEENGFKSATLNEDGSITYVMTAAQHKEMMDGIRQGIDEGLSEMAGSEAYPSIVRIEANSDYTQYKVYLNTEEVGMVESVATLGFYVFSGTYHVFNGTTLENVNIQYVSESTGQVIQEINSSDIE